MMANELKKLRKGFTHLSRQLDSNKGLMVKKTFDMTTSVYGHGRENKPYMTVNARGDVKISVLKLLVVLMFILSTAALVLFIMKNKVERCRIRKPHKPKKRDEFDNEGWV